jgi:hypothetical protein
MPEKDKIFTSKVKFNGVINFSEFYQFCYDWLRDDFGFSTFNEEKYAEKLSGDSKNIEIEWVFTKSMTDYFKLEGKASFRILGLTNVEIGIDGKKVKTNKGSVELKVSGALIRDQKGKFERTGFLKFLRAIYEKTVIPNRVEEFEEKVIKYCDDFLSQAKAFLDLEGKR